MKFHSIKTPSHLISFREALFQGIASDRSLFVPEFIPKFPDAFLSTLKSESLHSVAEIIASSYISEIPLTDMGKIVRKALSFPIPLKQFDDNLFLLELFHGPTLAFKDIGARFMAEVMSYFLSQEERDVTILVATSGDTGSAVAHGFFNAPHIDVYILYPSGKISRLQEHQMTTLGGNIHAVEIEGTFDDCQRLVKESLVDKEISASRTLTTANSINLGRLIPQVVYYVWGTAQWLASHSKSMLFPTYVVPSGNVGNLTAGIYAKHMGTQIQKFIAAANRNDVVPQYLESGTFTPMPSIPTLSNAMDVGNPSNLARLQWLYRNDINSMRVDIDATSITDEETIDEIRYTHDRTGIILDPHTAVGVSAARKFSRQISQETPFIITATAHPAKFPEVIRHALGIEVSLPSSLQEALEKSKQSTRLPSDYRAWKKFLLA